jgi:hypothetical protein
MTILEKFYTGIGSRETPAEYLAIMTELATYLNKTGWTLRSGGSWGADEAFQKGVSNYSNIFLPRLNWRKDDGIVGRFIDDTELVRDAMYIVSKYDLHEDWDNLLNSRGDGGLMTVKLHTRNVFQVLGDNLKNPSKFLVCYTNDGAIDLSEMSRSTGGTRTAMRLACHFQVPIFNLRRPDHKLRILNWIEEMKEIELKKNNKIITNISQDSSMKRTARLKI